MNMLLALLKLPHLEFSILIVKILNVLYESKLFPIQECANLNRKQLIDLLEKISVQRYNFKPKQEPESAKVLIKELDIKKTKELVKPAIIPKIIQRESKPKNAHPPAAEKNIDIVKPNVGKQSEKRKPITIPVPKPMKLEKDVPVSIPKSEPKPNHVEKKQVKEEVQKSKPPARRNSIKSKKDPPPATPPPVKLTRRDSELNAVPRKVKIENHNITENEESEIESRIGHLIDNLSDSDKSKMIDTLNTVRSLLSHISTRN
jgi:hypothetical protein